MRRTRGRSEGKVRRKNEREEASWAACPRVSGLNFIGEAGSLKGRQAFEKRRKRRWFVKNDGVAVGHPQMKRQVLDNGPYVFVDVSEYKSDREGGGFFRGMIGARTSPLRDGSK